VFGLALEQLELGDVVDSPLIVIHPSALRAMRLQKDSVGNYLDPFRLFPDVTWLPHSGCPAGAAVAGDFRSFALFFGPEGLEVQASMEHTDLYLRGQVVVRCQARVQGAVRDVTRFVVATGL
jgi:Phage capsid family